MLAAQSAREDIFDLIPKTIVADLAAGVGVQPFLIAILCRRIARENRVQGKAIGVGEAVREVANETRIRMFAVGDDVVVIARNEVFSVESEESQFLVRGVVAMVRNSRENDTDAAEGVAIGERDVTRRTGRRLSSRPPSDERFPECLQLFRSVTTRIESAPSLENCLRNDG